MDSLQGKQKQEFTKAMTNYLMNDILRNHEPKPMPIWLAGQWNKGEYVRDYKRIINRCCSICNDNAVTGSRVERLTIDLRKTDTKNWSSVIDKATLPVRIQQCLKDGTARSVWVYVKQAKASRSHALLLLFDCKKRLQIVFDPHGESRFKTIQCIANKQWAPGYRQVPITECQWAPTELSLQGRLKKIMHADEHGMCGILSLFTMLTCIRFNYNNPKHVADVLADIMTANPSTSNQLISWYNELAHTNSDDRIQQLLFPESVEGMCRAYSPSSKKLCSRASCSASKTNSGHCWQHRYLIMNRNSKSQKCSSEQVKCRGKPSYSSSCTRIMYPTALLQ
jgi:hypothetical protein